MSKRPVQSEDKYVLRLPDGMRERIKSAAESNNRSMNAEIVATLEKAYPKPDEPLSSTDMREVFRIVGARIDHAFTDDAWRQLPSKLKTAVVRTEIGIAAGRGQEALMNVFDGAYEDGRISYTNATGSWDNPFGDPMDEKHIAWVEGFETEQMLSNLPENADDKASG